MSRDNLVGDLDEGIRAQIVRNVVEPCDGNQYAMESAHDVLSPLAEFCRIGSADLPSLGVLEQGPEDGNDQASILRHVLELGALTRSKQREHNAHRGLDEKIGRGAQSGYLGRSFGEEYGAELLAEFLELLCGADLLLSQNPLDADAQAGDGFLPRHGLGGTDGRIVLDPGKMQDNGLRLKQAQRLQRGQYAEIPGQRYCLGVGYLHADVGEFVDIRPLQQLADEHVSERAKLLLEQRHRTHPDEARHDFEIVGFEIRGNLHALPLPKLQGAGGYHLRVGKAVGHRPRSRAPNVDLSSSHRRAPL